MMQVRRRVALSRRDDRRPHLAAEGGRRITVVAVVFATVLLGAGPASFAQARMDRMKELQPRLDSANTDGDRLRVECEIAYLWLGIGCADRSDRGRFEEEAKRILEEYRSVANYWAYQDIRITYAQIQPWAKQEAMLLDVIEYDPRLIEVPRRGNRAYWVNRLKQGAVGAYLNGAASDACGADGRLQRLRVSEEAEKLARRMSRTDEGRRCLPLVSWWRETLLADEGAKVAAPRLLPPQTRAHASDVPGKAAARTKAPDEARVVPDRRSIARGGDAYESVEYVGTQETARQVSGDRDGQWYLAVVGAMFIVGGMIYWRKMRGART